MKRYRYSIAALVCCAALAAAGAAQYLPRPDAEIEYNRGRAAQKIGYTTAAIQAFRKAVEADPDYVDALSALLSSARAAQRSAQHNEDLAQSAALAGSSLNVIRALYEWRATAFPAKGMYQWALGQFDESKTQEAAERYYRKAVALDSGFVKGYLSLASTLVYRGDLAGARECLRKAYDQHPQDPEVVAAFAELVVESDPALCRKLTGELLKVDPKYEGGADLLSRISRYEGNLAERIATLERLKALFPPLESEASEWYMRFLFDAYNRTDPPRALALAQEMAMIMPAGTEAEQDWQDLAQYEQTMVTARTLMDRKSYAEAAALLSKSKPPYLVSSDPQTLLLAEATEMGGNTARAYQVLATAVAEQPSDALQPALIRCGAKLKKAPAQVENDVWTIRLKKRPVMKDFELARYRDSKKVRLSDYRGRVVLVGFWYPGEGASREDFPHLKQLLDKYGPQGLTLITINTNPEENAIAAVLMGRYDFVSLGAPDDQWAARTYKVNSAPTYILIDRQGRALFRPAFWSFDPRRVSELEIEAVLARAPGN